MAALADAPLWVRGTQKRQAWTRAYRGAERYLCKSPELGGAAGPCYRPGVIANRVIADWGKKRNGCKFPNPGGLIYMGYLQRLYVVNERGGIDKVRITARGRGVDKLDGCPKCFWSHKLQAVVCFPTTPIGAPKESPYQAPKLCDLYEEWHDGKEPIGLSRPTVPDPKLPAPRICVATQYISDKFSDDGDFTNYIHVHDAGVWCWLGSSVKMVRGGRLALTRAGLIH